MREAADGEAAIASVASSVPDVVLLDLVMPGIDGLATAARIRALPLPNLPRIVAVTANAFEESRRRSLAEGCDAFLTKPIDFEQLNTTLGTFLGLDWQYSGAAEPVPSRAAAPSSPSVAGAELAELHDLAHAGDVMALEARAEALAADPRHAAFAAELRAFIARMDLRGMERWLKSSSTKDGAS